MSKIVKVFSSSVFVLAIMIMILCCSTAYAERGTASFYNGPYTKLACGYNKHQGTMIAAASDELWDNGAACGSKYKIKCVGATNDAPHSCRNKKTITVKIVDYCPPGCASTIDLSQPAFAAIADPDAGIVKIDFHQV